MCAPVAWEGLNTIEVLLLWVRVFVQGDLGFRGSRDPGVGKIGRAPTGRQIRDPTLESELVYSSEAYVIDTKFWHPRRRQSFIAQYEQS